MNKKIVEWFMEVGFIVFLVWMVLYAIPDAISRAHAPAERAERIVVKNFTNIVIYAESAGGESQLRDEWGTPRSVEHLEQNLAPVRDWMTNLKRALTSSPPVNAVAFMKDGSTKRFDGTNCQLLAMEFVYTNRTNVDGLIITHPPLPPFLDLIQTTHGVTINELEPETNLCR